MKTKALLVTTNGSGMGHLARMTAVALAGREELDSTLLTFSVAAGLTDELEIPVEYCPSRERGWHSYWLWDAYMEARLCSLIAELQCDVVVFDGVMPYDGLIRASAKFPRVHFVWSRRGMWQHNANRRALERSKFFDLIIEPADIAGSNDGGLTAHRTDAARTAPVTLLSEMPLLSKTQARMELGLPQVGKLVYVSLSSLQQTNADVLELIDRLSRSHNFQVVTATATTDIAPGQAPDTASDVAPHSAPDTAPSRVQAIRGHASEKVVPTHETTSVTGPITFTRRFPLMAHLTAFDAVISAAGYNAVHEAVAAGIPTLLIPDTSPTTDDQVLRANTCAELGLALTASATNEQALAEQISMLLGGFTPQPVTVSLAGARECAALIRAQCGQPTSRVRSIAALRIKGVFMTHLGPIAGPFLRRVLGRTPGKGPRGRLTLGMGSDAWRVCWTTDVRDVADPSKRVVVEHVLAHTSSVYAQARRKIAEDYYLSRM